MTADLVRYCRLNAQPSLFYADVSLRERITFYVLTLRSSTVVYCSLRFFFFCSLHQWVRKIENEKCSSPRALSYHFTSSAASRFIACLSVLFSSFNLLNMLRSSPFFVYLFTNKLAYSSCLRSLSICRLAQGVALC